MNYELRKNGFSLTEVLLAVGILAIGLVFIAGTFPVGIGLTTVAAERTVAAVAADEAFAKIRLYGVNVSQLDTDEMSDFNEPNIAFRVLPANSNEVFVYPSVETGLLHSYYWSALCRKVDVDSGRVQVTVFVCRKTGVHTRYPRVDPDVPVYDWPRPVLVSYDEFGRNTFNIVSSRPNMIRNRTGFVPRRLIVDSSLILDDETGQIYRVLKRDEQWIYLDRDWVGEFTGRMFVDIWVVPPAVGGGRNPVIGVYQRVIKF